MTPAKDNPGTLSENHITYVAEVHLLEYRSLIRAFGECTNGKGPRSLERRESDFLPTRRWLPKELKLQLVILY